MISLGRCIVLSYFKSKFTKKNKNLLDKFLYLEKNLGNPNTAKENSDYKLKKDNANLEDEFYFEEEVLWWQDSEKEFEHKNEAFQLVGNEQVVSRIKKTLLYKHLYKCESLKLETVKEPSSECYLLITWDSDYLNLSERRNYLNLMKGLRSEFKSYGNEVEIIHNNKRLGISTNIGIKVSTGTTKEKLYKSEINNDGEQML